MQIFGRRHVFLDCVLPSQSKGMQEAIVPHNVRTNFCNLTLEPLYKVLAVSAVGKNRHRGGADAMTKICQVCAVSDLEEFGVVYWHRSHQIPGVRACWKHGVDLIDQCQGCGLKFHSARKALPNLSDGCSCGASILETASSSTGPGERELASFAHDLLMCGGELSLDSMYKLVVKKYSELYGRRVNKVSLNDLYSSLVERYGVGFVDSIDGGGSSQRVVSIGKSRMGKFPFVRFLLICFGLFKEAGKFYSYAEMFEADNSEKDKLGSSYRVHLDDGKLREIILNNALAVRAEGGFPKRLSRALLLRGCNVTNQISLLRKYESSCKLLNQLVESVDYYRLKRILWTAGELRLQGESVNKVRFIEASGMNYRYVSGILDYLGVTVSALCEGDSITIEYFRSLGVDNHWVMPGRVP